VRAYRIGLLMRKIPIASSNGNSVTVPTSITSRVVALA
jgi:hypothetical protein